MSTTHYVNAIGEVPCGKVNYRDDFTAMDGDAVQVDCPTCLEFIAAHTSPAIEPTNADLLAEVKQLREQLSSVVEFVEVIKGIGAQAAKGGGMQAMMLRNMVPGIEQLGGQ